MKRDLELIRSLLSQVEDAPNRYTETLVSQGFTKEQISYHAWLSLDAGLARGAEVTNHRSENSEAILMDLTWKGHQFVDAARNKSLWKKAIEVADSKGGHLALNVLTEILVSLLKIG